MRQSSGDTQRALDKNHQQKKLLSSGMIFNENQLNKRERNSIGR
jgi:hypothetical protein